jgi:hypothetical protein
MQRQELRGLRASVQVTRDGCEGTSAGMALKAAFMAALPGCNGPGVQMPIKAPLLR